LSVENRNRRARGVGFGEDACPGRTGHGPANRAACTDIALALILHRNDRAPRRGGTSPRIAAIS